MEHEIPLLFPKSEAAAHQNTPRSPLGKYSAIAAPVHHRSAVTGVQAGACPHVDGRAFAASSGYMEPGWQTS